MNPEKTHLQSKKFVAYLVAELTWKAVLVFLLVWFNGELLQAGAWIWGTILAIVVCATFLEVGYILGQAGLDLFVRGIGLVSDATSKVWGKRDGGSPEG